MGWPALSESYVTLELQSAGRSLILWQKTELSGRHLAWEGAHVWQRIGNSVGCLDIRTGIRQRIWNPTHRLDIQTCMWQRIGKPLRRLDIRAGIRQKSGNGVRAIL